MRIGIALEDSSHFEVVTRLVDDALLAGHLWLDGVLEHCRSWCGVSDGARWYHYNRADAFDLQPLRIGDREIKLQGFIGEERLQPEARMWRRVLLMFCHSVPRPEVVVLVRDMDGDARRRGGMVQVREGYPWPFKVILATPQPEIEAWEVSGFEPQDEQETNLLERLRRLLSFDPRTQSHRLTSRPNDAVTDAKKVLTDLCPSPERRAMCIADAGRLRGRGKENGLAGFLDEVDARIVPALYQPRG